MYFFDTSKLSAQGFAGEKTGQEPVVAGMNDAGTNHFHDEPAEFARKQGRLDAVAGHGGNDMLKDEIVVARDQRDVLRDPDSAACQMAENGEDMMGMGNQQSGRMIGDGQEPIKLGTDTLAGAVVMTHGNTRVRMMADTVVKAAFAFAVARKNRPGVDQSEVAMTFGQKTTGGVPAKGVIVQVH